MITAELVNDAINCVVSRFKRSQLHIRRHFYEVECVDGEPFEVHYYIEDEIQTLLKGLNIQSNVELIDMYEVTHMNMDIAVLVVSFVFDGKLYNHHFIVEGETY